MVVTNHDDPFPNNDFHLNATLPHEVGHAFDVLHPHRGRCWFGSDNSDCANCHQEAVSRAKIQPVGCGNFSGDKKCEVNGDGLCDTEADPNCFDLVQPVQGSNWEFEYIGQDQDNWGEDWAPDVYNIMSYSLRVARERFSPSQIGIMYYWILGLVPDIVFPSQFDLHIENDFVDVFEPDNHRHNDNEHRIDFGETQHRGLHAERYGLKSNPSFGYCDEDWIHFTVPGVSSTKVDIETNAFGSAQQVDTELFLFEDDGTTLLTNNDDKATGDIYSKITEYELAPGDYWIQVVSNGSTSGEYTLSLNYCEVECCFQSLIGSETVINSTTGPFNLGSMVQGRKEFFGSSVTVTSQMGFNDNIQLGFGESTFPLGNSELEAEICNNALIDVTGTGQLNIGSSATGRTAKVRFLNGTALELNPFGIITVESGSELIIENGAELRLNSGLFRVQDGAKVIIKEGGLLRYEDGATIELNGNDAQLVLEGLTYVGDNATFGFSYTGTESGYIRIAKEGHWGERFAAGVNANVHLEGEDEEDLILYLEEGADFWEYEGAVPNQPFSSNLFFDTEFRNGKVIFEDDARMVLISRSKFYNCSLLRSGGIPRGIIHFRKLEISNSNVTRVDIESALHHFNEGALVGINSNFNYSDVYVRGYGYYFRDCVMDHTNLTVDQSTIGNRIIRSTFQNSSPIADFSTTELTVTNSTFTNNDYALYRRFGRVTIKCSSFTNNGTAIEGSLGSIINMSTLYNGGYNYFDNNDYNIQISDAHDLTIDQGYNEFYDADILNVWGTLNFNSNSCPKVIYAYNNIWTPASGSGPNADPDHPDLNEFDVTIQYDPNNVLCNVTFKFGPVAEISSCGEHDLPEGPKSNGGGGEKSNDQLPLVTTGYYFQDTPIDYALKQIASNTTTSDTLTGDDAVAADMYYELLSTVNTDSLGNDSIKTVVEHLLWNGLHSYKAAIERLLQTDAYSSGLNQTSFQPVIEDYVSTLMQYTDSIKTPENYHRQFMLEMMKTTLFRNINKPEKSLQILVNIADCSHDSLQQILLDEMIQNVEFDIEAISIGEQAFLYDSLTFELDSSLYEIPLENFTDTTGFGTYINSPNALSFTACTEHTFAKIGTNSSSAGAISNYSIFPNPASTNLIVKKQVSDKGLAQPDIFELYDLSGRIVYSTPIPGKENFIELPSLGSGLYLFMIKNQSSLRETGKLTVINM